jgi:hypothetical protein
MPYWNSQAAIIRTRFTFTEPRPRREIVVGLKTSGRKGGRCILRKVISQSPNPWVRKVTTAAFFLQPFNNLAHQLIGAEAPRGLFSTRKLSPMSTAAQLLANQTNATLSTGPVTSEGKSRVSQNATKLGLFSTTAFVRCDEREIYEGFVAAWEFQLRASGPVEEQLAADVIQAAWRLRRCTAVEQETPADISVEDADRTQVSIDRARATAGKLFHRSLNGLRHMQTERHMREGLPWSEAECQALGVSSCSEIYTFLNQLIATYGISVLHKHQRHSEEKNAIAKQSQSESSGISKQSQSPEPETASIARTARCPCGSGQKYKRCCGKGAPPVLYHSA